MTLALTLTLTLALTLALILGLRGTRGRGEVGAALDVHLVHLAQLGVGTAALEGDALALGRVALDGGREGPRTDAPMPPRLANRGEVVGVPSPDPNPTQTLTLTLDL